MKVNFSTVLKDRFGKDYIEANEPITLGSLVCAVLDSALEDDTRELLREKLRRAELIKNIMSEKDFELLDTDIEMIKERIGKRNFSAWLTSVAVKELSNG